MSSKTTMLQAVRSAIQFESLNLQARNTAQRYAGKQWTDFGEHDPGVTLMEGVSYSFSDLSWRHTLPFKDLLTPDEKQQTETDGIFPAEFGPQQALTCGPITPDDYRKQILDLTDSTESYFLFRNAQLLALNSENPQDAACYDYIYYYDAQTLEFSFRDDTDESVKYELRGNYALYLEPMREASQAEAENGINDFLLNHRNLGESVSHIVWAQPAELDIQLVLHLDEQVQDVAQIYADVYNACENLFSPRAQRITCEEAMSAGFSTEDIYQGPNLDHGWIRALPPAIDYTKSVSIDASHLPNVLLAIAGISRIESITCVSDTTVSSGHYFLLWGMNPIGAMINDGNVKLVTAAGEYVTATPEDVQARLSAEPVLKNSPVILPYGTHRKTGTYYPVSDKLPQCYKLLDPVITPDSRSLYRFLLVFEQWLANGCDQLQKLPELLSFVRTGMDVWGDQWPYSQGSTGDNVHHAYKTALMHLAAQYARDYDQEIRILNYLLGYFNARCASPMLETSRDEFLSVEQKYLSQITELSYQRDNIRIDKISALQKRIAARLGLGGEIFSEQADMKKLPFYLVEHRALLPAYPSAKYDVLLAVSDLQLSEKGDYLTVFSDPAVSLDELRNSQLISFVLLDQEPDSEEQGYSIDALIVDSVDITTNSFTLNTLNNPQLWINFERIISALQTGNLNWKNCQSWMEEISFPLNYIDGESGNTPGPVTLTIDDAYPFPSLLSKGDALQLRSLRPVDGSYWVLNAMVSDISGFNRQITVARVEGESALFPALADISNYSWHITQQFDRFSFVVSLVLNKSMLPASTDILTTENWIKENVQAEIPANTVVLLHWLDESLSLQSFESFANTYAIWLQGNTAPGTASWQLIWRLALGTLPVRQLGIGKMRVSTPEQRIDVIGETGDEWNVDVIVQESLFFVPKQYSELK